MINSTKIVRWWKTLNYGIPTPRFISPLVRINGVTDEMPAGYHISHCNLPPTVLQIDECNLTLRVNDAQISLLALLPCFQIAAGTGVPNNPPSDGYLPFYVDQATKDLYAYAGGNWIKTT